MFDRPEKIFARPFINFFKYLIRCFLIAVRHNVNNFESSVVVQELELAMKRALNGLL